MIKNTDRDSKKREVENLKDRFVKQGCNIVEQVNGVLLELQDKADNKGDVTQLPSGNELVPTFVPLYAHEKHGQTLMRRILGDVRRFNEQWHPRLKIYALRHDEMDARGAVITRYYVQLISGKPSVKIVNNRLARINEANEQIMAENKKAEDSRAVAKYRKTYLDYLRNKSRRQG